MTWNYRILAHKYKDEVYLEMHEVYYDEEGIPNSYTLNSVGPHSSDIEGVDGIKLRLRRMLEATKKPVLWADDKFPMECNIVYTCKLCGRNFTKKIAHNCNTGFRKRNIKWEISYE